MKFSINILMPLFILIFISACSSGGSAPTSTSFNASSTTITIGDSVDLTAVFTADGTGSIDHSVGTVTSDTPVTVSPSTTTTYTLTVTKSDGSSETSALTVTVVGLNFLSILNESFDQVFQASQPDYTASVGFLATSIQIKATSVDAASNITVNGVTIGADNLSQLITLAEGADKVINIIVTQNTVSKTYTITVSRALAATFAEQASLKASNVGADDAFGYSVALSGDTLAVGAYLEDSSSNIIPDDTATDSGAVYVFTRTGGIWEQQAYLKASNTGSGDEFGYSVALSGDTLAVGAIGEASSTKGIATTPDELAASSGAVYVFVRTGSSWSEQAYIKASNTGASDRFGISVSLSDDTLAVGADREDSTTTGVNSTANDDTFNSGAAYVFTRNEGMWSEQAYIKTLNTGANDSFGTSVALWADTLAVGAPGEDSSVPGINKISNEDARDSGAVYVFMRTEGTWVQQAYIKSSDPGEVSNTPGKGDEFGANIALYGDTLAVGARFEDSNTTTIPNDDKLTSASGAVYVFIRNNNIWSEQAYIKSSNTDKGDHFGRSVALSGNTLAVGAELEDSSTTGISDNSDLSDNAGNDTGAVYIFSRSGTDWIQKFYVKALIIGSGDEFGFSAALSGDTLAVGAPLETTSEGAVYTFE